MSKELKGTFSITLAVMLYGMYGVFSRMIGENFGAFSQNWIRSFILIIFFAIYYLFNKKNWVKIRKKDIKWLIIWPLTGASTTIILFMVFNNLPLGTSYFLFYSTMIVSGFISGKIFFKEKLNKVKIISGFLAVTGLVIIYSLDIPTDKIVFVIGALLAGFLVGLWNTLSKKVSSTYKNFQLVAIDIFVTFLFSFSGAIVVGEKFPILKLSSPLLWIFIFAITQVVTVSCIIYGFKRLEAQIGSVIMPMEVLFATAFGFLFFKEILPVTTLLGGLLIASAAILPNAVLLFTKKTK